MAPKRKLNRGLEALLGPELLSASDPKRGLLEQTSSETVDELPIELIQRGQYQPRREFGEESLETLAQSIRAQGLLQPIIVRSIAENRFEILSGERRWRACQMVGLASLPAVVKEVSDEDAIAIGLIENIQRENLNPVEEGLGLKRLRDEFGLNQEQIANVVGRSRPAVANLLRLLTLETEVLRMLERRKINTGHAKALLGLSGGDQIRAARQVIKSDLSVRQSETLVRRWHSEK
ncbi:MAG: ParB/RepB/Spo0J family partition protein, partial [SAR202 cluster bacterium]|nr:ParB/RepB/Spo0J family partition protein [SAR202 cluster bacterium]